MGQPKTTSRPSNHHGKFPFIVEPTYLMGAYLPCLGRNSLRETACGAKRMRRWNTTPIIAAFIQYICDRIFSVLYASVLFFLISAFSALYTFCSVLILAITSWIHILIGRSVTRAVWIIAHHMIPPGSRSRCC